MKYPLFDLTTQYLECKTEIDKAFATIPKSGRYLFGEQTEAFECELAAYLGVEPQQIVSCGSGTDALILALLAENIGAGDEVIIPSMTAIPTAAAVVTVGATPVFADMDPDTWLLDAPSVRKVLTDKTKAIIPVHLYGNVCNLDALTEIAHSQNLVLIEDTAQAFDSEFKTKKAGTIGDYGAFSFYPTKNLGAMGDGGAVFCRSKNSAEKIRKLRFYGQGARFVVDLPLGLNSRMHEFQAAILSAKLKSMSAWTQNKQKLDKVYREIFGDSSDVISQSVHAEASISWHLKVLRVPTHNRKQIMQNLESHSVGCDIHYPTPLHLQKCYQPYFRGPLTETEKMASEILSIPMHAHLTEDNISEISGFLLQ